MHIDGVEIDVAPGDITRIPSGAPHFFRNTSSTEKDGDLLDLRVHLYATRTIIATGVTTRIDEEHKPI